MYFGRRMDRLDLFFRSREYGRAGMSAIMITPCAISENRNAPAFQSPVADK
jgi:hypothetical protein